MRLLISVDMEGVAGLVAPADMGDFGASSGAAFERGQLMMTEEANAAIAGAFQGGADEVWVTDAHYKGLNLLPDVLDERAELIRGPHKPHLMVEGVDQCDALALVGCHGRAGAEAGVLNHTLVSSAVQDFSINGEPAGEIRLNALIAGSHGAPVVFVSGDGAACAEASELLGGELTTCVTKTGLEAISARSTHPHSARREIHKGVEAALRAPQAPAPYTLDGAVRFEFEWKATTIAAVCGWIPTVDRPAPRTTSFETDDIGNAIRVVQAQLVLAGAVAEDMSVFA